MKAKILLLVLSGLVVSALNPVRGQEIIIDRPVENAALAAEAALPQPETKTNVLAAAIPAEAKCQNFAKPGLPENPAQPAKFPVYTVRSGDNLSVIAKAYGVSAASIMQENHLNSSSLLRIGQSLKIPGGGIPDWKQSVASGTVTPATSQPATPPVPKPQSAAAPEATALFAEEASAEATESLPASGIEEVNFPPLFGEENSKSAGPNLLGGAGSLLSLGLKLGFVVILAYVVARAARQFALRKSKSSSVSTPAPNQTSSNMEILETITLGPERWLHVVTIGSKAYLLSSTPQQTALITEVTETNLIQELREKQALESGFAGQLAQLMAGGREQSPNPTGTYGNNYFAAKLAALNPFGGRH